MDRTITRMTTKEMLDWVATPDPGDNGFTAKEAMLSVAGGIGRRTHTFCFEDESPVKKKRRFWHSVDDCSAVETEKFIMEMYGGAIWGVFKD